MSLLTLGTWVAVLGLALLAGFSWLPDAEDYPYPTEVGTAITDIIGYTFSLDEILPITEFFAVISIWLVFMLVWRFIWKGILWIMDFMSKVA